MASTWMALYRAVDDVIKLYGYYYTFIYKATFKSEVKGLYKTHYCCPNSLSLSNRFLRVDKNQLNVRRRRRRRRRRM